MATDGARTLNGRLAGRVVLPGDSDWDPAASAIFYQR
jgi:hypothetical protein